MRSRTRQILREKADCKQSKWKMAQRTKLNRKACAEKREVESWQLSLLVFSLFFLFFFFLLLSACFFFNDQTRHILTQTREVRRDAERQKGDREKFASLDLWITD